MMPNTSAKTFICGGAPDWQAYAGLDKKAGRNREYAILRRIV